MRHTAALGIVTNNPNDVFQQNVIAGVQEIAARKGYKTIVGTAKEGIRDLEDFPLQPGTLAGILVIANIASNDVLRRLHETGIPMSLVSHSVPDTRIPSVIPDNATGISQLVRHIVVDCGRRRLAFIQGHMEQNDGISRSAAFRQELIRHNLPANSAVFLRGDFDAAVAARSLSEFLEQRPDLDALIAADYLMAVAALNVLSQAGLRVPDEVCVAGFGDGVEAAEAGVTTVAADVVELGRRACRQLIGQIEGLDIRGITVLSTELIARSSTLPITAPA